jgi:hypothetical protein
MLPTIQESARASAPLHKKKSRVKKLVKDVYKLVAELRRRIFQKQIITTFALSQNSFQQRHRYQQQYQAKQNLRRVAFAAFVLLVICLLVILTIYFLLVWLFSSVESMVDVLRKLEGGDHAFHHLHSNRQNDHRKEAVRDAFLHAWKGYETYAFGHDEIRPVSNIVRLNYIPLTSIDK